MRERPEFIQSGTIRILFADSAKFHDFLVETEGEDNFSEWKMIQNVDTTLKLCPFMFSAERCIEPIGFRIVMRQSPKRCGAHGPRSAPAGLARVAEPAARSRGEHYQIKHFDALLLKTYFSNFVMKKLRKISKYSEFVRIW